MDNTKKVHYFEGEVLKDTKELTWPQQYEDLIKEIIQNFDLINKNVKVNLKIITTEGGDVININSQDDLEEYTEENNIEEFKFSIEENKDSAGITNPGPINIKELEKLLDPNLLKEEEDLDIDNLMRDMFDNDGYKKKKEEEENKYSDIFNQNLEKSVGEILSQKSKTMEEEINNKLINYSDLVLKEQKEAYNSIMNIKDNLGEIKDALSRSVPPRSVKAVKKRTRAGFGKCQGGFCQPSVVNLLAKKFNISPLEVLYDGEGSNIIEERLKEVK